MLALFVAVGLAHAGWTQTDTGHGCTFLRGETEASGATPVRVECSWNVKPAELLAVLGNPGEHHRIFDSLAESESLGHRGGIERVRQVHKASGASNREVIVDVTTHDVPGGKRFSWTKSADQTGHTSGGVEPDMSDGFWEVRAQAGGSLLIYESRYLAGGSVPPFLIRWFQGAGIKAVIGDLRTFMTEDR